jgi:hypothetical protein
MNRKRTPSGSNARGPDRLQATRPQARDGNAGWSVDFVHNQHGDGRRLRILKVVDDVTKACLAAVADTSISGRRVGFAAGVTALTEPPS